MSANDLVVVQAKLATLGLAVLGQALFSKLLIETKFQSPSTQAIALVSGHDPELEDLLATTALYEDVRVVVDERYPPRAPRMEPKRDPSLRQLYEAHSLRGWTCAENFPLTTLQKIEAVYVRGRHELESVGDLAGEDVVFVHTSE